jgi:hypothetical protein
MMSETIVIEAALGLRAMVKAMLVGTRVAATMVEALVMGTTVPHAVPPATTTATTTLVAEGDGRDKHEPDQGRSKHRGDRMALRHALVHLHLKCAVAHEAWSRGWRRRHYSAGSQGAQGGAKVAYVTLSILPVSENVTDPKPVLLPKLMTPSSNPGNRPDTALKTKSLPIRYPAPL